MAEGFHISPLQVPDTFLPCQGQGEVSPCSDLYRLNKPLRRFFVDELNPMPGTTRCVTGSQSTIPSSFS